MTRGLRMVPVATCLLVLLGGCFSPQSGTSGRVVVSDEHASVDIVFSDHDRALIREHYRARHQGKYKNLPPGLEKKNQLPPGIQKQLVRRNRLPQGAYYQRLPYELERHLSRIPDGYLRVMIEGSVVLFNENSRVIFDVMHDL